MGITTSSLSTVKTSLVARQVLRSNFSTTSLALEDPRALKILLSLRKRTFKDRKKNLKVLKRAYLEGFHSKMTNLRFAKSKI